MQLLTQNPRYQTGNYETALKETYLAVDVQLRTPQSAKEVICIRQDLPDSAAVDGDIDERGLRTALQW